MILQFRAADPFLKQRRTDKSWTITFECGEQDYDEIKDLPKLQGKLLLITVNTEPREKEID